MKSKEVADADVLEQAAEWIVQLNDSTATESDFIAWQAWLSEKPTHAEAFHSLHETWRRSAAVSRAPMSRLRALDELDETNFPARHARRGGLVPWAAAAALALVVAGGALMLWHGSANTIRTATAELRSVRLPDGSRAALGPETNVQIAYSEHRRSLRMKGGEAYFEVARAPERPFSVETPAGRVVAIGTSFSVNLSGQRMAVTVTEGSVRIEPLSDSIKASTSAMTQPVVIAAGQRYVQENSTAKAARLESPADAVSWREGRLQYEGEPLRVVVADINRYSPTKLRIADSTVGELRYTGTVFPDSLDVWLSSIEGVFPLRVQERQGERVIVGEAH